MKILRKLIAVASHLFRGGGGGSNGLGNKIIDLRIIMEIATLGYIVMRETKLDQRSPNNKYEASLVVKGKFGQTLKSVEILWPWWKYLIGFWIFAEISGILKKNVLVFFLPWNESHRLRIYLEKFCLATFLWCQRSLYCIFMRNRCENVGE